jgi:Secretion system C-terminal sorting domain
MKRFLPLLLLFLTAAPLCAQHWYSQDNQFIYPQKWFGRYLPSHVAGFRTAIVQRWQPVDGVWINTLRHANQYVGANNLPQSVAIDVWNAPTNSWKLNGITNYNFANNILQNEVQQVANAAGVYATTVKDLYVFGTNNRVEQLIAQGWNNANTLWINAYRDSNVYRNNQLSLKFKQLWSPTPFNLFYDDARDSLTYDANGRLAINFQQAAVGTRFSTAQRDLMTYNATGNRTELRREFVKDITINSYDTIFRWSYTYNAQNNPTVLIRQQWNNAAKIWQNHTRVTNTYNTNGKITQELVESATSTGWTNVSRTLYDEATDTRELLDENTVTIYPNPTHNNRELIINANDLSVTKIQVFNAVGQCLKTFNLAPNSQRIPLTVRDLTSGTYVLKIETTKGFIVKKWSVF